MDIHHTMRAGHILHRDMLHMLLYAGLRHTQAVSRCSGAVGALLATLGAHHLHDLALGLQHPSVREHGCTI